MSNPIGTGWISGSASNMWVVEPVVRTIGVKASAIRIPLSLAMVAAIWLKSLSVASVVASSSVPSPRLKGLYATMNITVASGAASMISSKMNSMSAP